MGTGLLCLLDVPTSTVSWVFLNLVAGLGTGMLFPSSAFAIQASNSADDQGFAVAFFSFTRTFGQAVGVAIGGVIFQNQIHKNLLSYPNLAPKAEEYSQDATALVEIIKTLSSGKDKEDLVQAFADSLKIVWAVICGMSVVASVSSLWTKRYSMDLEQGTEQGLVEKNKAEDSVNDGVVVV